MTTVNREGFYIVGLEIRTSNNNGEAAKDIPALWQKFMAGNKMAEIPNRVDDTLYCAYTKYEGDYTQQYSTVLGCRVTHLEGVPKGFAGLAIAGGTYAVFTAKGKMSDGIVFKEWLQIWNTALNRAYTTDYEVYSEKAHHPILAEVDIFIALK